jgi:chromate transporter
MRRILTSHIRPLPSSWKRSTLPRDFALALAGFLLLTVWKLPPWIVVVFLAAAGVLSSLT